jgi:hypothetical protein
MRSRAGEYVEAGIVRAGLPVDETMDWGAYIHTAVHQSLLRYTQDYDRVEEAVLDGITTLLYLYRPLDRFNPEHPSLADLPLPRRVTAFLFVVFRNLRKTALLHLTRQRIQAAELPSNLLDTRPTGADYVHRDMLHSDYVAYVREHDPILLPFLDAVLRDVNQTTIAATMGVCPRSHRKYMARLQELYLCMQAGTEPPTRRAGVTGGLKRAA